MAENDCEEAEAGISENDMNLMSFSDVRVPCTVDVVGEEVANDSSTRPEESQQEECDEKLNEILVRHAAALEQLTKSINNCAEVVATGLQGIAAAMSSIARALEQQDKVRTGGYNKPR